MSSPHVMSGRSWRVMLCRVVSPHICNIWSHLCHVTRCNFTKRDLISVTRGHFIFNHRICCVIFFQVIFIHVIPCLSYLSREIMTCYHTFIVWFYMVFVLNVWMYYLIPSCLVLFFISSHRTSQFYPQQRVSMGLTVSCKTAKEFSH